MRGPGRIRLGAAVLLAAAAAFACAPAGAQALLDWIEGDWHDPRVHRCGEVWVRIAVGEKGDYTLFQRTYGREVPAARGRLERAGPRMLALENETLGREQRIRYVSEDAHVLEKPNGAGGVTFVRCPDESLGPTN